MNACVKTGCDIAFLDSPSNAYHGDAYYFEGMMLFKVRAPQYRPSITPDFIISGEVLETTDVILVKASNVRMQSAAIRNQWEEYCPEMLTNVGEVLC